MSSGQKRKLLLQKSVILSVIGIIAYGIAVGYADFYRQVSQYTKSVAYRESQEACMEYTPKLMKKNQRLLSQSQADLSAATRYV